MEMKNHTQLALWPSTQFMTGQRHWKKSDLKTWSSEITTILPIYKANFPLSWKWKMKSSILAGQKISITIWLTTHSLRNLFFSAWLDVLVGQSWECCFTLKPCLSLPPFFSFCYSKYLMILRVKSSIHSFSPVTQTFYNLSYLYSVKNILISLLCKK